MSDFEYLDKVIKFNDDRQFIDEIYTNIMRVEEECFLHPDNLVIKASESEYIPLCYLNNLVYSYTLRGGVINGINIPIVYLNINSNSSSFIREFCTPNKERIESYCSKIKVLQEYYFNNGLVIRESDIAFACCIKVEYIINAINEYIESIRNKEFYKLFIDNEMDNEKEVIHLLYSKVSKYFEELIKTQEFVDNIVCFKNTDIMDSLNTLANDELVYIFSMSSYWGRYVTIAENSSEWFNSKIFYQPEPPSFTDIDGPEKEVLETMSSYWG